VVDGRSSQGTPRGHYCSARPGKSTVFLQHPSSFPAPYEHQSRQSRRLISEEQLICSRMVNLGSPRFVRSLDIFSPREVVASEMWRELQRSTWTERGVLVAEMKQTSSSAVHDLCLERQSREIHPIRARLARPVSRHDRQSIHTYRWWPLLRAASSPSACHLVCEGVDSFSPRPCVGRPK